MSVDPFAVMAADVAAMLSGFGSVAVTCGASAARGIALRALEDLPDVHGATTQGAPVSLTIPAGALGVPTRGAAVTVNTGPLAGAYRFRQFADGEVDGLRETWLLRKEGT